MNLAWEGHNSVHSRLVRVDLIKTMVFDQIPNKMRKSAQPITRRMFQEEKNNQCRAEGGRPVWWGHSKG